MLDISILVIVNDPKDWPIEVEGVEIVPAKTYLTDSRFAQLKKAKVFNLCRSYKYQSTGYYVSLLAEARGHKPLPDITTVQDIKSQAIIRLASEDIDRHIQNSLKSIKSKDFVLSVYFGKNVAKRHDILSQHLFKLFRWPLLRASFIYNEKDEKWYLSNITPIAASEIPDDHYDFVREAAEVFFRKGRPRLKKKVHYRYDIAILHDPSEKEPPSNKRALQKFIKAAESLGMYAELIQKDDYDRIAEFDALFIRETTSVNHHTYRFSRRAAEDGLVVVDDPESILKCTNKVFLAEILNKNKIPIPKTLIVHRENIMDVVKNLGFPCILKRPDSSFSQGVIKVKNEKELQKNIRPMLQRSDLVIAQEFLPTSYDWRIGIFERHPLFACKYFMAGSHWQIIKRDSHGKKIDDGRAETLPIEFVPQKVIKTALKAANLIGDGLYGVDIKENGNNVYVIEVNDNPNIDAGIEDVVLKNELYLTIMRVFLRRIEERKRFSQWA